MNDPDYDTGTDIGNCISYEQRQNGEFKAASYIAVFDQELSVLRISGYPNYKHKLLLHHFISQMKEIYPNQPFLLDLT